MSRSRAADRSARRGACRGHSLVELLVALVLGATVLGIVGRVLVQQQRLHRGVGALVELRSQLSQARDLLPSELGALAPAAGDVVAFSDSALDVQVPVGTGVICEIDLARDGFQLPPAHARGVGTLSSFAAMPNPGDVAHIFSDGATDAAADDRWHALPVAAAAMRSSACAGSPFIDLSVDAGLPMVHVQLAAGASIPPDVQPGSVVRVARHVRWALYSSSTGWQLGRADWNGAGWSTIQPVAGPFLAHAAGAAGGIALRYFDENGGELHAPADAGRIARVAVAARAATATALRIPGMRGGRYRDSLLLDVAIRNRP